MISRVFQGIFCEIISMPGMPQFKGFVKIDNEIIFEISPHTAAVFSCITHDLFFGRNNFDIRAFVEGIYHNKRTIGFRKSETKFCSPFSRSKFGSHIIVGQVNTVIIWFYYFSFMRIPTGPVSLFEFKRTGNRHDGELAMIVHPW